ncbi:hypothetical protein GOV10_01360, partial [Candidatus Woesearchaeota archaeon]|nr:hypothetical protein [Candidatus Woesearchaeota archaeon]
MRKWLVYFLFLLLLPLVTAFEFTELMPNPAGDDNNQEFIELFTNKKYNFSNTTFFIADEASNDTLEFLTSFGNSSQSFFLIVEEAFDYSFINETDLFGKNISCRIFSVGATIGNNLANEGENLAFFFDNQSLNTSYVVDGCADGEGCSLVARNNTWSPEAPTPCGFPEAVEEIIINVTHNESNVTSGPCVANFSIQAENIFLGGETVTYKPLLVTDHSTFSYEISYWWEDLHGNIVKDARSTNNLDEKRYTPRIPEHETDKAFFIRMRARLNCTEEVFPAEKLVVLSGEADAACDEIEEKTCENSGSSGGGVACTKYAVLTLTTPKETNEQFLVALTLHNNDFLEYEYRVYAYAYRGS